MRLIYLFDPLCGWCYGAAPAVAALATRFTDEFDLMPAGLFGPGRRMTREFGSVIWGHDQRIAALTGQLFSDAYRDQVLGGSGGAFDSGPSTRALTLLARDGESELPWLHRFQRARWIDGRETGDPVVVAEIVAETSGRDVVELARQLQEDSLLARATGERIARAHRLMQDVGISGVPAVVIVTATSARLLNGESLYDGGDQLIASVESLVSH